MATVKHVVLDSNAFLRNVHVQNIGEKLYTIQDVVEEIKDKATKQRLQVLPYELIFREPSVESIKIVSEFAKKTGDYRSLSAVDIRLLALSYQLEKEFVGTDHIKIVPEKKVQWNATPKPLEKAGDIAGFYIKPKGKDGTHSQRTSECSTDIGQEEIGGECSHVTGDHVGEEIEAVQIAVRQCRMDTQEQGDGVCQDGICGDGGSVDQEDTPNTTIGTSDNSESTCTSVDVLRSADGQIVDAECIEEEEESEQEEESDDDDDDGWITPSNIKEVKAKMGNSELIEKAHVEVGCLTTDFAMQNVLLQMGLNVISVDGMLIKKVKNFVLRCSACMKITTHLQKEFCPHCGNKTMSKVSMTVEEDGTIRYFLSKRRVNNIRGTKFSLPMPKGGKHAMNPHLVEDQPCPHNRVSKKSRSKVDVFNPDFVTNTSPFTTHDINSRASMVGVAGKTNYWDRRNPNAVRKFYKRK